jgi:hypothetical protein
VERRAAEVRSSWACDGARWAPSRSGTGTDSRKAIQASDKDTRRHLDPADHTARKAGMFEFAIYPDDAGAPTAIFVNLEDAIDFGVQRYGCDRFSIRRCLAMASEGERAASPSRTPVQ